MLKIAIILLMPCLIIISTLHGYDFDAIPDMTWVSFGDGPRYAKSEYTTAYDHINNVWVNGFG